MEAAQRRGAATHPCDDDGVHAHGHRDRADGARPGDVVVEVADMGAVPAAWLSALGGSSRGRRDDAPAAGGEGRVLRRQAPAPEDGPRSGARLGDAVPALSRNQGRRGGRDHRVGRSVGHLGAARGSSGSGATSSRRTAHGSRTMPSPGADRSERARLLRGLAHGPAVASQPTLAATNRGRAAR